MADVVMIAVIFVFFGLAVLLVRACDSIIGPDPTDNAEFSVDSDVSVPGADRELVEL